jgi:predicted acyltransferase
MMEATSEPRVTRVTERLKSIDALRGFDMFWIIGGDYLVRSLPQIVDCGITRELAQQMEHCEWAGFHFYDLIYPMFVFLVGVSLVFSLSRTIERSGKTGALKRIVPRSLILFLLGIFYMGGIAHGFKNVYFVGVLHRIAVAYFFTGIIFCFASPRVMAAICVGLLVGYWALMTFVPVPGVGEPSLAVSGKNLAYYIDQRFMPGRKFEGTMLSTMAAVANCLLGVFAGLLLKTQKVSPPRKVFWLISGGAASVVAGYVWGLSFPIIKLLWTSSYVLVACGISSILLGLFYVVIEIWKVEWWAEPFVWIGMNAITIYIVGNIVNFHRLAERFVGGDVARAFGNFGLFVQALVTIALGLWLVRFLYRRKIFLRL